MNQHGLKVPTLVMMAAQDARRWAGEIGAEDFVPKPFDITDLLAEVERLLGKAGRTHN